MSTILEQIVQTKRQEVVERQARIPLAQLQETITTLGRPRNFFHALTQKPQKAMNVIAEVKKASPERRRHPGRFRPRPYCPELTPTPAPTR